MVGVWVRVRGRIAWAHLRREIRAAGAAPPPTRPRSRKCLVRGRSRVRGRVSSQSGYATSSYEVLLYLVRAESVARYS